MKLWIIGKTGLVSQAFQRVCRRKSIDFIATSQGEVDLLNAQSIQAQFATLCFTHVVNCGAYTAVDQAEVERDRAYALNVHAVIQLGKLASHYKKKLIHFSTNYVFDGEQEGGYPESAFPRPISVYGKTKEEGERQLFEHCPHAFVLRTSSVFDRKGKSFVTAICEKIKSQVPIKVVSDQMTRPTFAEDLVEAALRLIDAEGIFHFANKGAVSPYQWALEITEILRQKNAHVGQAKIVPILARGLKTAAKRPRAAILETEKYEKQMATTPRHWKQPLKECLLEGRIW